SYWDGNHARGDAIGLYEAQKTGWNIAGTDEDKIASILRRQQNEGDLGKVKSEYQKYRGRSVESDFRDEMQGAHLDRSLALLEGNEAKARAANIRFAMQGDGSTFVSGWGTDANSVYRDLSTMTHAERKQIIKEYEGLYGSGKRDVDWRQSKMHSDAMKEWSLGSRGPLKDRFEGLLDNDMAKAEAARARYAMKGSNFWPWSGAGTDEVELRDVAQTGSSDFQQKMRESYQSQYRSDFKSDVRGETSGYERQRMDLLMKNGKLTEAQEVYFAVRGLGTDEDSVHRIMDGRSKAEIAQLRKDYAEFSKGGSLDDDLLGDFTGRADFEMRMSLKGRPENALEAYDQFKERFDYERGLGSVGWRAMMGPLADQAVGGGVDNANRELNAYVKELGGRDKIEGLLKSDKPEDKKKLERLWGLAQSGESQIKAYRSNKDGATDVAATVGTAAVTTAIVVGTAGTATPVLAVAGAAAAAGAATNFGTRLIMQGNGYNWEDSFRDVAVGAIDGATAGISVGKLAGPIGNALG
ncbi:MAG: hypothetical protein KC910_34090, partial [Candidatus Eremiobacteraeota bacterium]|nr:hypothetical protein [Candidatus Eremiobacteraeota bacterium]